MSGSYTADTIQPENLDAFANADDLWSRGDAVLLVGHYPARAYRQRPNMSVARRFFPERPRGYVAATSALGHYAHNTQDVRRSGRITTSRGAIHER